MALILAVIALYGTGLARDGGANVPEQLLRTLIHADDRPQGVVGTAIDFQNILHTADKLGTVLGRNTPALLQVGLDLVFFSVCRMVS
jgi:hypothetical protein